jgi:hypothetical protein
MQGMKTNTAIINRVIDMIDVLRVTIKSIANCGISGKLRIPKTGQRGYPFAAKVMPILNKVDCKDRKKS